LIRGLDGRARPVDNRHVSPARVAVTIMAKAPRPGEVKTRLCPPLAAAQASELYRCFLLDKIAQVRALDRAAPAVAYTPGPARGEFERLAPGFALVAQRGRGLGERLTHAVADVLAAGHAGAIMTDTDTPTLPGNRLAEAVRVLEAREADVVVGPSEDGGYYLIGVRAPAPALFEDVPWSTPAVLPVTLERARRSGLGVRLLPAWFDVDTGPDLDRLRAALAASPGGEPRHTRRFLAALGAEGGRTGPGDPGV
jgi:rSAM/selenodomain-associated transferase 1